MWKLWFEYKYSFRIYEKEKIHEHYQIRGHHAPHVHVFRC